MQRIYIANFASNTITKIPFTCRPTPERIELEDGAQPITLAVHPDQGRPELWVAEFGRKRISVIDTNNDRLKGKPAELGLSPRFLAFHPKGCFAYVVSEDNRALYRIRPADRQIDGDLIIPKQSGKVLDLVVSNNNVVVVLENGSASTTQSCARAGGA